MKSHFFKSEMAKRTYRQQHFFFFYTAGNLYSANFTTAKWAEQSYYRRKQNKKWTAENQLS